MRVLDKLTRLDRTLVRNIVSLRTSVNLFDDLVADDEAQSAANAAEMHVRDAPAGQVERGLYYSQAIDYPFSSDQVVASRFGDGSIRVWYGAFDEPTARAETCWHALQQLNALIGAPESSFVRYRAVYDIQAQGLFADLRGNEVDHPFLVGDDYAGTQGVGKYASSQGLQGLIYPSPRWPAGECLAAFKAGPLSVIQLTHYLTYRIDLDAQAIEIERTPGQVDQRLHVSDLRRG